MNEFAPSALRSDVTGFHKCRTLFLVKLSLFSINTTSQPKRALSMALLKPLKFNLKINKN